MLTYSSHCWVPFHIEIFQNGSCKLQNFLKRMHENLYNDIMNMKEILLHQDSLTFVKGKFLVGSKRKKRFRNKANITNRFAMEK